MRWKRSMKFEFKFWIFWFFDHFTRKHYVEEQILVNFENRKNHKNDLCAPRDCSDANFVYISCKYDNQRLQISLPGQIPQVMTSHSAVWPWGDARKWAKIDDFERFRQNWRLFRTIPRTTLVRSVQVINSVIIYDSTLGRNVLFEYRGLI